MTDSVSLHLSVIYSDWRSDIISFSCSTNIDKNTASIGSRSGATVQEEACTLALFMRLSNATLFSPRNACEMLKDPLQSLQEAF
jgi:hypothetical protein